MKNNKEVLDIHLGGNMNVGTLTASAIYDIMEVAQMESIFRLAINFESYPNHVAEREFKFRLALQKTTKEIKEGKEYSWTQFMAFKHRENG